MSLSGMPGRPRAIVHLWMASAVLALQALVVQAAPPQAEDYRRAMMLGDDYAALVDRLPARPAWVDDGRFLYRRSVSRPGQAPGWEYRLVEAASGRNQPAFDADRLVDALREHGVQADPVALDLSHLILSDDALMFVHRDVFWRCVLPNMQCASSEALPAVNLMDTTPARQEGSAYARTSPDGRWRAWIAEGNLVLAAAGEEQTRPLSRDGGEAAYYSAASLAWSPDSTRLVAYRVVPPAPHVVSYIENAPAGQVQPRLHQQVYTKPGDPLAQLQPVLFEIATGRATALDPTLFPTPYALGEPRWRADGRAFTFEYNARGHQRYRVIEADGRSGITRTLIEETSPTTIYHGQMTGAQDGGGAYYRHDFADGERILWASERDGWKHLYLYDAHSGRLRTQVTRGAWVVRRVERVDESGGQIWFTASGMDPDQDPYYRHAYRVGLDGRGLVALTTEPADHEVSLSPDGRWLLDLYSRVDLAPVLVLRDARDGRVLHTVETADISRLRAAGWQPPIPFHTPGRDGKTAIWGVIHRPQGLDPARGYPVVEDIYAGPHGSFVPKRFNPRAPALTALGFAVAQIDGMGTNNRSRAFRDVSWRNLRDGGFPDRIAWHRAAAAAYPWYRIDDGVGIYGTSAGGQNALAALLFHPGFYTVAVANSGNHDNRMDKISWNEQWMGWPVGSWYSDSSNVDNAWRLQGHLLLITGDMDQNVDPASTLQVTDRLIKAGKDFDLLVVPGGDHGAGGRYGQRRLLDFFVRWLRHAPTPDWNRDSHGEGPDRPAAAPPKP